MTGLSEADGARGRHRQEIHVLDLPLPKPPPEGYGVDRGVPALDTVGPA